MGGIFNPEGKFAHYGGKLWDLMWLNVLVILCSVPVFTMGASMTAMHYVILKIYRDEETAITKIFFKSFRDNFKQSTVMTLIFAFALYCLVLGFRLAATSQDAITGVVTYLLPVAAVVVICIFVWGIVMQSRYHNSIMGTIRLALAAILVHPVRSLAIGILFVLPFAMAFLVEGGFIIVTLGGFTLTGLLQTGLYNAVFYKLEHKDAEDETTEINE